MYGTSRQSRILALTIVVSGVFVAVAFAVQKPRGFTGIEAGSTPPKATQTPDEAVTATTTPLSINQKNLTNTLIQTYAEKIAEQNQDGLKTGASGKSGISFPDKKAIEDLVTEKLKAGFVVELATANDLIVTNETSNEAARAYLGTIQEISVRRFPDGPPSDLQIIGPWITNRNATALFAATNSLDGFITDLKRIPTPSPWRDFQLALVNLQIKRLTIYRALLAMDTDPLQATLAADLIDKLATAELEVRAMFAAHAAALAS